MDWCLPAAGTYGVYRWDRKLYRRIVVADDVDRDVELRMPRAIAAGDGVTLRGRVTLPDGAERTGSLSLRTGRFGVGDARDTPGAAD
jgi:hypothetical protein